MARYKVLKSVAHSLGHSFTSTLNWGEDDYVMGNILQRAREVGEGTLKINLMSGKAMPSSLLIPSVERAAQRFAKRLPDLVESHGSDMRYVHSAVMSVVYDLQAKRPNLHSPSELESPYICRVEIADDRGKVWTAELRDWWTPEPERLTRRRWWLFWKPAV
jgi:hypothetical protein